MHRPLSRPIAILSPRRYPTSCRRTLIPAPKEGSGPIIERRPDRDLPPGSMPHPFLKTMPIFLAIMTVSALALFNYQKASSSVVNSTLYSLRYNERAREVLGEQIYFKHRFPWIWGELNNLKGRINISYKVKGTKGEGMMNFKSYRRSKISKVRPLFMG